MCHETEHLLENQINLLVNSVIYTLIILTSKRIAGSEGELKGNHRKAYSHLDNGTIPDNSLKVQYSNWLKAQNEAKAKLTILSKISVRIPRKFFLLSALSSFHSLILASISAGESNNSSLASHSAVPITKKNVTIDAKFVFNKKTTSEVCEYQWDGVGHTRQVFAWILGVSG